MATATVTQTKTFTLDGSALRSAILAVAGTRDKADKHGARGGINIRCSGAECAVAATDGYRLSVAVLDAPGIPSCEDTFAGKALEGLAKRLNGAVTVTADGQAWTFAGVAATETLPTLGETFPHYAPAIPDDLNATTVLVDTASWTNALRPLKRQSKDDPALAHLWLRAGGSALTASQCGFENYSRGIGTELVQGPDQTVTLDADFIKPILKSAGGLPIRLHVHATDKACRFDVGSNLVHVLMPCLCPDVPEPSHDASEDAPAFPKAPTSRLRHAHAGAVRNASQPVTVDADTGLAVPVMPTETGYVDGAQARANVAHNRAVRRAAQAAAARTCPNCGEPAEEGDRFCAMCGTPLVPTLPERTTPNGHTPHEPEQSAGHWPGFVPVRVKYHGQNPQRIYGACPHASDVRGFHDWLKAGRAVQRGQKGIMILAPVGEDADGEGRTRFRTRRAWVFDISQTAPVAEKAPAAD